MRLAGPDVPSMPFSPNLENEVMMNPDKILENARTCTILRRKSYGYKNAKTRRKCS